MKCSSEQSNVIEGFIKECFRVNCVKKKPGDLITSRDIVGHNDYDSMERPWPQMLGRRISHMAERGELPIRFHSIQRDNVVFHYVVL